MREILTLSSGQAGVNLGSTFFEYISKEHDIDPNGSCSNQIDQRLARSDVYHDEAQEGKYVPRAIFADLDSNAVDNIRSSSFAQLYNANNFITNNQSSGNNWAVGHYTRGAEMIDEVIDCINKEVEKCDSFQGFQLLHSISGGCGSGLGSLIALKNYIIFRPINRFLQVFKQVSCTSLSLAEPFFKAKDIQNHGNIAICYLGSDDPEEKSPEMLLARKAYKLDQGETLVVESSILDEAYPAGTHRCEMDYNYLLIKIIPYLLYLYILVWFNITLWSWTNIRIIEQYIC